MTRFSWDRQPVSRRSILAAGGVGAAALALAACGSNTGRSSGGGDGTTLKQWYHAYGEDGVEDAVKKFAADYKDATVEVSWIDGYDDQLGAALLKADQAPDVYEAQPTISRQKAGHMSDVTDLINADKEDWVRNTLDAYEIDGKYWGIPQAVDMQMLVYRPSMLKEAGFSEAPKSVDELVEIAKATTKGNVKGLFVGNDGGPGVFATPAIYAAGLTMLNADHKDVGFNDPQAAAVLTKLKELRTNGSLLLGAPTDWSDPGAISNGLCAMQWTGLWTFPQLKEALKDDFAVAGFPAFGPSGKAAVPFGAYHSIAYGKGKNVEASKDFIKWLWVDQTDKQLEFQTKFGFHIPPRKSLAEKAEALKSGPAADAVKLYQENGYHTGPYWTDPMSKAFSDAATNILTKDADAQTELQTAIATIKAELGKN